MLIKRGFVINPRTSLQFRLDIRIKGGIIAEMGSLQPTEGEEVIDATKWIVAPGLIDTQVHFRDPDYIHKEDLHAGPLAAAKGGFTSVIYIANSNPSVDNIGTQSPILNQVKRDLINVYHISTIPKGLTVIKATDFSSLAKADAIDHAPHTALGLGIKYLVKSGHLSMIDFLEKMTSNPAKLYNLPSGSIEIGKPADLVIFHPDEQWQVGNYVSGSSNSPFTGEMLPGKIYYTICNGKIVYAND